MTENVQDNTSHTQFHLLAFTRSGELENVLLPWVALMYLLAVFGNTVITILVCLVSQLQTPMYFFLCNLAVQDVIYVSTALLKLIYITLTRNTIISFHGCMIQMFVIIFCVGTEFFLLTCMAYDRYVAICIPLHYLVIMNKRMCALLALISWKLGAFNSLLYTLMLSKSPFCHSQEINHFFCYLKSMIKLSCIDTAIIKTILLVNSIFLAFLPFVLIIISYIFIISTVLKIQTSAGKFKAFSSCFSHLTIVIVFFGACLSLYLKPDSEHSEEQDKLLSLLYVALVPMLNPLVYSLRNKVVWAAVKKLFKI